MEKATRQFTDRTEPQAAFRNAYLDMANKLPGENNSRIITYYGMGGIGKSWLLKQLQENLSTDPAMTAKNGKKPLFVDFDFEGSTDGVLILEHLYKKLEEKYKWNFSRFEWALHYYRKTIGEKTQEPHIKSFAEAHPKLATAVDVGSKVLGFTPLGGVAQAVNSVVDIATTGDKTFSLLRNVAKPHEDLREKFDKLTPKAQKTELLGLFADDLNNSTKDISVPLVILLDTYEIVPEGNTWWLRGENGQGGLISLTKNTLWVIAGRHKLQWKVKDCNIEQHLLGDLSCEDAGTFLTGAGIPQDWIPTLYKLTGGTPVYLDLCVDRYEQLKEQHPEEEPELSQFDLGDVTTLLSRYVEDLDPRVKEMVYMLSFIPLWDKKLVCSAAQTVLWGAHVADFNKVTKLSITHSLEQTAHTEQILYTDDTEHKNETLYFIHRTVAETLRNDPNNRSREDTAQFLIDHFRPVLDTAPPYSAAYARALGNILHGGLLLHQDRDELADFYRTTMQEPQDVLCRCHCYDVMHQLLASYWERAAEDPTDFLYAAALYEKAWRTYQHNHDTHAFFITAILYDTLAWTLESLHLLQKLGEEDHILVPQALEAMAEYFAALGHPYEPNIPIAVALHQYAIHLYKIKHPHDPIALISCRSNLALTYQDAHNYDAAAALLRDNLELAAKTLEPDSRRRLQALQELADFLSGYGDLEEALKLSKQALKQKTFHLSEKDPDTLHSMIALANLHRKMDNIPEEAKLRDEVLRVCRKYLPQDHQDLTAAISDLADAYRNLQDHLKELPLREELMERLPTECTEGYPPNFSAVVDLARVYHHLQWWDERDNLCLTWCRAWANESIQVHNYADALLNIVCHDFQDYSLGKQLWQILSEAPLSPYKKIPLEITRADILFHCGEPQEALDILEEIRKAEPRSSYYWREALEGQIEIRRTLGQMDLAQKIENIVWDEIEREAYALLDFEARQLTRYEGARAEAKVKDYATPTDLIGLSLQEILVRVFLEMPSQCFEKLPASVAKELDEQARLYTQQLPMQDNLKWDFIRPDYSDLSEENIKAILDFIQESAAGTEDSQ